MTTEQRTALVTGGGRGIGEAIAKRLAREGFAVAVCDIDLKSANEVAMEICGDSGSAQSFEADVGSTDAVRGLFSEVSSHLGEPDVLVNNAGVISIAPIVELSDEEWDRVLRVNLTAMFLCIRAALPSMTRKGWGRVVNIASDGAKTAEPLLSHYCASKFGVLGLTQSAALETATDGVTVNAICPAICDTPMMQAVAEGWAAKGGEGKKPADYLADFVAEIPTGRVVSPADVAAAVAFLASDDADLINGQAINVSGAHEVH